MVSGGTASSKSFLKRLTLTGVEELYITVHDVQPPRENFLQLVWHFGNTRGISVLKFSSDIKLHGCDLCHAIRYNPRAAFSQGWESCRFQAEIRKLAAMFSSSINRTAHCFHRIARGYSLVVAVTLLFSAQSHVLAAGESNHRQATRRSQCGADRCMVD